MKCASRVNEVAIGGFFNFDRAIFVEAIRESTREHFGHVLDDYYARAVGGHGLKKFAKSFSAASGGAHGNDFVVGGGGALQRAQVSTRHRRYAAAIVRGYPADHLAWAALRTTSSSITADSWRKLVHPVWAW